MRLSRLWLAAVTLLAALAVAAAVLVPFLVQREIDRQVTLRLEAAAAGADAQLQLFSRRWIDSVSHAALDGELAEALDHASTNTANLELLHKTAVERLRSFEDEWKIYQVIAVDAHARVIARASMGKDAVATEERWKDDLSAAAVVTEALKGFRLDDTWVEDGRLLTVAAAPVVVRDRFAGAVLAVIDLGAELAQPLASRVGAAVAFAAGGKVLGQSGEVPPLDAVLADIEKRGSASRTEPMVLPFNEGAHVVMTVAVPGTTKAHPALLVVGERPRMASPAALRRRLLASLGQLPWLDLLPIGGALLAALLLGSFLIGREHSVPLDRLENAALAVTRSEAQTLSYEGLPASHAAIARIVNAALEKARGVKAATTVAIDPQAGISLAPMPPLPSVTPAPVALPALESRSFTPSGAERAGSLYLDQLDRTPGATAAPPPSMVPESRKASHPPGFLPTDARHRLASPVIGAPVLDDPGELPALDEHTGFEPPATEASLDKALSPLPLPGVMQAALDSDPVEDEMKAVFQEFVDTRQRCGESLEGITYDRFAAKLTANREQLMARYNCSTVKFQVYVKDGKAALKATPVT